MFNFEPRTIVEENLDCLLRKNKLGGTSSIYRKLPVNGKVVCRICFTYATMEPQFLKTG